jgi:hypothetical protein
VVLLTGCGAGGGGDFSCQGLGGNTVSGTVRYEKKLYDPNGFTGQTVFLPVRFATIEVVGPKGILATTTTDDQGRYCGIYIKAGEPTVNRVRVTATNVPIHNVQVGFFFDDSLGETNFARYAVSKTFDEKQGSTFTVDFSIQANSLGGVFNIMDILTVGHGFFKSVTGNTPPLVTAAWQEEIGGTFFITRKDCEPLGAPSDCIFVQGDGEMFFDEVLGGDRDEYDDDIILHEYGHFIAHNFSRDNSPGGIHFLGDHTQDIRLSWSEGWATFFSSAVRNNPVNVDVAVIGEPLFAFSIESNSLLYPPITPEPLNGDAIYTTSEVAVASVLWDIFDDVSNPDESLFDSLSLGFGPIWDVLNYWHQSLEPANITAEAFWDSFGQIQPEFISQALKITEERQMEFFADAFEDDNSIDKATPIVVNDPFPQDHTLLPAGDEDYISFQAESGQSYTIETLKLANGADTYLEILYIGNGQEKPLRDAQGNPYFNDNPGNKIFVEGCAQLELGTDGKYTSECPNNETALASKVVIPNFVPPVVNGSTIDCPTPCTLYARVSRSPNAPLSTGRYGSYDFRVTSP